MPAEIRSEKMSRLQNGEKPTAQNLKNIYIYNYNYYYFVFKY